MECVGSRLMKEFKNPAIVLGGGTTTGLGAIRCLGRSGVEVYYLGEDKEIAVYSKYCKKYFILPRISHDKSELAKALLKIRDQTRDTPVLFPSSDSYALNLSDLIDKLNGYHLPAPKSDVIKILINKRKFYQSLVEYKIHHPTTRFPENLEDLTKTAKQMSYPVFIKPSISHAFAKHYHRKGFLAHSQRELLRYWTSIKKTGFDALVQEIVPGPPASHAFLDGYCDKHSNPKALFARRRLRMWPLAFGNSSLCTSIPVSEIAPLKETLFRYLKSINYHGIFSAEFKRDERDGVFKLLEINSRTSAWFNTLSAKCGVNLMLIAYLDAIGVTTEYTEEYEANVKWVFLTADVRASTKLYLNGDMTLRKWISSMQGKKDYLSYAKDDLRPFITNLLHTISEMIHAH